MLSWLVIFRRELADYFYTPIAYVFLIMFLTLNALMTFYVGDFFAREQADLSVFFSFHPWLYLVLAPALGMRLWAEERKTGTIQTLLTLPISTTSAFLGKLLASWVFISFALLLTTPIWFSVNYLGDPDNGVIVAAYISSLIMAGSYLSIASCMSAITQNQVIAFVLAVVVGLIFTLGEISFIKDVLSPWLPQVLLQAIVEMSFLTHFSYMAKGVVSLTNLMFMFSVSALFIFIGVVVVNMRKNN